ncbi:ankyrin repeat domain-containing protein [Caulobacter endophyticus]|uniref:ankyrin repeat domain-containing protein n=1 Tax=Caulobacter endophyticus TaxID=2172652 RepID=UPI00240F4532|nr:ankyrin repeat domain-containing protein [Caulobacter endophyticus]MDG2528551.1 ankyrin repeat domain-containing protein [Caulobacter endophyticus]
MTRTAAIAALAASMVMMTDAALAACFVGGTALPDSRAALAAADHGQAGRDVMAAVLKGDVGEVQRRLRADPALKTTRGGSNGDLLSLAIARCDKPMVAALLDLGVPPDGAADAVPLSLALRATDPAFATQLLAAGASPQRREAYWPLKAAIGLNSLGAVRLLLQHGAKVDDHDASGATPLRLAVEQQNFRIAGLLLEKGADPWTVGSNGETVGTVLAGPMRPGEPEEQAARPRVLETLKKAGWAIPGGPDAKRTRQMVLTSAWPPPEARAAGWKNPPPAEVVARMRRFWTESGDKRSR